MSWIQYSDRTADTRKTMRLASHTQQKSLREQVISALGGKCRNCSFEDHRALQIDHPSSNGSIHRDNVSWSKRYKEVLAHPENFKLLCANCNWIKRHDYKEAKGRPRKVA